MDENINNKISVEQYIEDPKLLELTYIPFDTKMEIVSQVINSMINSIGGLNTTLLRRLATEVFIESISNIDMNAINNDGLKGFDELLLKRKLNDLIDMLGYEYQELQTILNERVADYIRIETNPSVTLNAIYENIVNAINSAMEYISERIQNADVESIANILSEALPNGNIGGDDNEA